MSYLDALLWVLSGYAHTPPADCGLPLCSEVRMFLLALIIASTIGVSGYRWHMDRLSVPPLDPFWSERTSREE